MAVFLAASDETEGARIFHYAGFVAPVNFWTEVFVPAWEREVLDGPPKLDEFHTTKLRSSSWREKQGISAAQAEDRIDAAVELISKTKDLCAIRCSVDGDHFDQHLGGLPFRLNDARRAPVEYEIDYQAFFGYVYSVLHYASADFIQAEKVDFVIEKKNEMFPAMHEFYKAMRGEFVGLGLPHFSKIMGELIPGNKKKIPLQAADLLCWHTQRKAANMRDPSISFSKVDARRLFEITQRGSGLSWTRQMIEQLGDQLFRKWRALDSGEETWPQDKG